MENIFDLDNIKDIPDDLRSQLKLKKLDDFSDKLLQLFELAERELSVDEIMISYFRKYDITKTRRQIVAKMYSLSTSGHIERVPNKRGVYNLEEKKHCEHI